MTGCCCCSGLQSAADSWRVGEGAEWARQKVSHNRVYLGRTCIGVAVTYRLKNGILVKQAANANSTLCYKESG